MTRAIQLLLLFLAQSTVPREVVQLARIKHDMTGVLSKMPDYMCEEIVERSARDKGARKFRDVDTMRLDVAFVGGKELFGRHDAGHIDKSHPSGLTRHGVTSNGEFTGHARSVFMNNAATMRYFGPDKLDGRETLRWDYSITTLASDWSLNYAGRLTTVASKGSFWVDPESLDVLQLDVIATEIEPGFPIAATHLSIGYGKVRLGNSIALIPQKSVLLVTGSDGTLERNLAQFRRCHEYGADTVLSFDK
jgi:hypothetical protein